MGVLLCILGTVVRYKIISVDDQRFGQIVFLGFLKKDVASNSILANNREMINYMRKPNRLGADAFCPRISALPDPWPMIVSIFDST